MKKIGEVIRSERKKRSLTQQDVADSIGVKRSAYACWEISYSEPTIKSFIDLCILFDLEVVDFL